MKKLFTIVFTLGLILSLSSVVMAEEPTYDASGNESWSGTATDSSFDTKTTINKENAIDDGSADYYVSITWNTTNGAYQMEGDTYKWDAENRKYIRIEGGQDNTIDDDTKVPATSCITITNQSNARVSYEITYTSAKQDKTNISSETSTSGNKSGILASYVTSNSIALSDDVSGNEELDYSANTYDIPSVTYQGSISLKNYTSNDYNTTPVALGTYTISIKKCHQVTLNFDATNNGTGGYVIYEYDGTNKPKLLKNYGDNIVDGEVPNSVEVNVSSPYLILSARPDEGDFEEGDITYIVSGNHAAIVDDLDLNKFTSVLLTNTKVYEITGDEIINCTIDFGNNE